MKGGGGADVFVFEADMDADVVLDFMDDLDSLEISSELTGGATNAAPVVSNFAQGVGNNTVFDFGDGNTITLIGVTDESVLVDDLTGGATNAASVVSNFAQGVGNHHLTQKQRSQGSTPAFAAFCVRL